MNGKLLIKNALWRLLIIGGRGCVNSDKKNLFSQLIECIECGVDLGNRRVKLRIVWISILRFSLMKTIADCAPVGPVASK